MTRQRSFDIAQTVTALAIALAASIGAFAVYANKKPVLHQIAVTFPDTPVGTTALAALDLMGEVRQLLRSGAAFNVIFDACPFDDEGWDANDDPLGSIRCGQTYRVHLDTNTMEWVATGPNELALIEGVSDPSLTARASANGQGQNVFLIWGADFRFDEQFRAMAPDGQTVLGRIELVDEASTP